MTKNDEKKPERKKECSVLPIEAIARVCHEANRAYCLAMDDNSQRPYDEALKEQRDSAYNGVKFTLENPNCTPEDQHSNWYKEKESQGWVYGPFKNFTSKAHPCMLPYDELPEAQRIKDVLFKNIVESFRSK